MVVSSDIRPQTVKKSTGWIVVLEKNGAANMELKFESEYEPRCAVIGLNVACWSANELAIVQVESMRDHRMQCHEFIQSVLPLDKNRFCVVCDTYVAVITLGEWRERIVLDHDEILVAASSDGTILSLTDLQGRVLTVPLP